MIKPERRQRNSKGAFKWPFYGSIQKTCDFTHNLAAGGTINWPERDRKALFSMRLISGLRAGGTIMWPGVQIGSITWP
jgi:hypothetical protein